MNPLGRCERLVGELDEAPERPTIFPTELCGSNARQRTVAWAAYLVADWYCDVERTNDATRTNMACNDCDVQNRASMPLVTCTYARY